MRILLTNDDGVYAPGLAALHRSLSQTHEVTVVAPETEQSAVGHSITLADPIRVRALGNRTGYQGFAITGTPADCVKLAVHELMDQPPQLVVSGINLGANLGVNLLYSGTVSAANEASLQGLASVAVSLDTHTGSDFSFAADFTAYLVENLDQLPLPAATPLNVNIPDLPASEIRGIRFTRQSRSRIKERFVRRTDPRGHVYYWLGGETMGTEGDQDTDYPALLAGYITITPVRYDLTNHEALESLLDFQIKMP
jgi:5'-nucleotidase